MAAVIANLAAGVSGDGAPKLLVGTGADTKHLAGRRHGDRAWRAVSTPTSSAPRVTRIRDPDRQRARTSASSAVGRKGVTGCALFGDRWSATFELSAAQAIGMRAAEPIATLIAEACSRPAEPTS
jgi:F-type H+-transporting ATPase subunit gamma